VTHGKTNRPHDGRHKTVDSVRGPSHSSPVHVLLQSLCPIVNCKPHLLHKDRIIGHQIANLICSYRVSCACEPTLLSIPSGVSRTIRHTTVVRIIRPSNFSFRFGVFAYSRPVCVCVVDFVLDYESVRHRSVIIRLLSSKIHIRDSYELY